MHIFIDTPNNNKKNNILNNKIKICISKFIYFFSQLISGIYSKTQHVFVNIFFFIDRSDWDKYNIQRNDRSAKSSAKSNSDSVNSLNPTAPGSVCDEGK